MKISSQNLSIMMPGTQGYTGAGSAASRSDIIAGLRHHSRPGSPA